MQVEVYSTPNCKYCDYVKKLLVELDIKYIEYDVSKDKERRDEMIAMTGKTGVPVVVIGDTVMYGYDKDYLIETIKKARLEI